MQWLALGLVVVLGAATLITQDSRFIMVKPTIIHWGIGAVMLRHGWMTRYLPPIARDNLPAGVIVKIGYAWAALMFLLGGLNAFIAVTMSFQAWAWFITLRCHRRQGRSLPRPVLALPVDHRAQAALRGAGALAANARADGAGLTRDPSLLDREANSCDEARTLQTRGSLPANVAGRGDHCRRRRRRRAGGRARAGAGRPRDDGAGAARADRLGDVLAQQRGDPRRHLLSAGQPARDAVRARQGAALRLLRREQRGARALRQAAGGDQREPAAQARRHQGDRGQERRHRPGAARRQRGPGAGAGGRLRRRAAVALHRHHRQPRLHAGAGGPHRGQRRLGGAALSGGARRARRREVCSA